MRRFHAFLLSAGLVAAPAGALARPSDSTATSDPTHTEKLESSASKGRLGVLVMSLTPELRTHFGSLDKTGVLVARVEPGSPAALAGIAVGDVLVDVNGSKVDDALDVIAALASVRDDQKITVKVLRDHKSQTLDVRMSRPTTGVLERLPAFDWLRELFTGTGANRT